MVSDLILVPAFENLNDESMDLLRPLFKPFSLRAGSITPRQGAPTEYLYFILKGTVEMFFKPDEGPEEQAALN